MQTPGELYRRLRFLLQRRRADEELAAQIAFHIDMETQANIDAGMSPEDARTAASHRFGNTLAVRERAHDAWGWSWLETTLLDARLALRMLLRTPAFAAINLASLAIGIGLTVGVFGVVNALLFKPVSGVRDPESLVRIYQRAQGGQGDFTSLSYPEVVYLHDHARSSARVAGFGRFHTTVDAGGVAEKGLIELTSPEFFSALGAQAEVGRLLTASDDREPVVVLTRAFWTSRFDRDPAVVGRTVRIGSTTFTIVGVASRDFRGLDGDDELPQAWVPIGMARQAIGALRDHDPVEAWGNRSFNAVARLAAGTTLERVSDELAAADRQLQIEHPERAERWRSMVGERDARAVALPLAQARLWPGTWASTFNFLGLLGAVSALVLTAACVNVANLLLTRTAGRRQELAVRQSLGAGTPRLVRQLITENLILSLAGAALGLLVARWTSGLVEAFAPVGWMAPGLDTSLDVRVVLFAATVGVLSGVVVTILPLRVLRRNPIAAGFGRAAGGPTGVGRWQRALVAGQVSISVVLVVASGLFTSTLRNARAVDVTVRSHELLLGDLQLSDAGYEEEAPGSRFYSRLLERASVLPGVQRAALVFVVPLGGTYGGTQVEVADGGATPRTINVGFNVCTPGYFDTVGIPLVAGREFTPGDGKNATPVAVVNEEMVARVFHGHSPIGTQMRVLWKPANDVQIVGVVRDGPFRSFTARRAPTVYVPFAQRYMPGMTLEVRAPARAMPGVAESLRREAASIDPRVPLVNVRTAQAHFDRTLGRERMLATLLGVLAAVALTLLAIGAYASVWYSVIQRTREIGIRLALGAAPRGLLLQVLLQTMRLTVGGLVVGLPLALAAGRLIRSFLFGVEPADPSVFVAAVVLLSCLCAAAAFIPARRASRIDPVIALRCE